MDQEIICFQDERSRRINEKLRRELGELVCHYLAEPDVIEIILNADGKLWVEILGGKMEPIGYMSASQAESLMGTIATTLRTTITRANPILECELPIDGSRFEALVPPVVSAPVFTIRRKASKIFTLDTYVQRGMMTAKQQEIICEGISNRKNILIVGGTGSGKTTLTNAIIAEIVERTPEHRLIIIEDTAEIQCAAENAVVLRATDSVDMQRLLKATMRLRPDRILVGEVRGEEALSLLKAWNTGHPGGVATVHANNAFAGLTRIEQLIAEVTQSPMQSLIAQAVDIIIAINKTAIGRQVSQILSVDSHDGANYVYTILES